MMTPLQPIPGRITRKDQNPDSFLDDEYDLDTMSGTGVKPLVRFDMEPHTRLIHHQE